MYETSDDLDNERSVLTVVANSWRCSATKLPRRYELDYALHEQMGARRIKAFAEIKCRNFQTTKYETVVLSLMKLAKAEQLSRLCGVPSLLIVRFVDEARWLKIAGDGSVSPVKVAIGGRTDRNDPDDIEVVAHFKIDQMRLIN
jgi:hypothetical protein